ncbi:ANKRD32_8 [Blepharisma stoltei]|uniref:Uncharacterized protein n=1 Tax=Blepharisma stoltei TaxID=1481888 RepID=A0AAU9K450_9CILI|nr:unnamed protein product [Blepharisma stoltei]
MGLVRIRSKNSLQGTPIKTLRFQTPEPRGNHLRIRSMPNYSTLRNSRNRTPSPTALFNQESVRTELKTSELMIHKEPEYKPKVFKITLHREAYRLITPRNQEITKKVNMMENVPLKIYDISNTITSMKTILKQMEKPKKNYWECLKFSLKHLKAINITLKELANLPKLIGTKAFGRKNSMNFFNACKNGKTEIVIDLIEKDKWLVHVFDSMKMTALHWAAVRDQPDIIKLLLSKNAFVDEVDMTHRTALYLACRNGHLNCVKILLANNASPHIRSNSKKLPLHVAKNQETAFLLTQAMSQRKTIRKIRKFTDAKQIEKMFLKDRQNDL